MDPSCLDADGGGRDSGGRDAAQPDGDLVDAPMGDGGPCGGTCGGGTPLCRESDGMCVACLADTDCTAADASSCDEAAGTCGPCMASAECTHVAGLGVCDDADGTGECVECTPATETTDCADESCDPATRECSGIMRASRLSCQSCVSDSDCMNADDRCVALEYMDAPRGGYCLRLESAGCMNPYRVVLPVSVKVVVACSVTRRSRDASFESASPSLG